jgi:hypothetical protein
MSTHTYYATDADPTDRFQTARTSTDRPNAGAPAMFDAGSTARLHNLFDRENLAIVETKR